MGMIFRWGYRFLSLLFLIIAGCLDFSTPPVAPDIHSELDYLDETEIWNETDFLEEPEIYMDTELLDFADSVDSPLENEGEIICSCEGKECGDDGCGNFCGECEVPYYCNSDGKCVCVPECENSYCGGPDGCGGTCHCILDGSFVKPNFWYPDRTSFKSMLSQMRGFGMSTVIITASKLLVCTQEGACSISDIISDDEVGLILDDIYDNGMKAILGLVDCQLSGNEYWWTNSSLIRQCIDTNIEYITMIYEKYLSHRALAGFYIPATIIALMPISDENLGRANELYRRIGENIRNLFPGLPVVVGANFIAANNADSLAVTPMEFGTWMVEFVRGGTFQAADPDIVIIHDGVGEYKNSLWSDAFNVSLYIDEAIAAASPRSIWVAIDLYQWSPTKSMAINDNYMHPASISRVRRQIELAYAAKKRIGNRYSAHMAENATMYPYAEESASLHRAYDSVYFRSNYIESASYSFSPADSISPQYPDPTGTMLFDDRTGEEDRERDWVGWILSPGSILSITVNLPARYLITDVAVVCRSETNFNVYYPGRISVYASADGSEGSYRLIESVNVEYNSDHNYGNMTARVSAPAGVEATKIKIELFSRASWLMLSEIEVN